MNGPDMEEKTLLFLSLFLPRFPAAIRSPGPGLPDGSGFRGCSEQEFRVITANYN